jgi:hypothetical protein
MNVGSGRTVGKNGRRYHEAHNYLDPTLARGVTRAAPVTSVAVTT